MTRWKPDAIRAPQGETVTWRFDTPQQGGEATAAHNLFVVRPGGDRQTDSVPVGPLVIPAGGPPVTYEFDQQGIWTFYCSIHVGMDGTVEVGAPRPDTAAPTTTATVTGDGTVAATVTAVGRRQLQRRRVHRLRRQQHAAGRRQRRAQA